MPQHPSGLAEFAKAVASGLAFGIATPLLSRSKIRWQKTYPTLAELAERAEARLYRVATSSGAVFSIGQGIPMFINAGTYETVSYGLNKYEPFTRELFVSYLRPGSRVLDLGAQFGIFTILAARNAPGGRVVAFEPEPHNFSLLQLNVRLNRVSDRVEAHRLAVGDTEGVVDFFVYKDSDSHAMHRHPEAVVKQVIEQQVVTIDIFLDAPTFDVIKIDIEGHEPFALEGMRKTLEKSEDVILFCELAPEYLRRAGVDPSDYLAQLRSYGFDARVIDEDRKLLRRIDPQFLSSGPPGRAVNLLCRRR
jgi:FkbM family methyltransferase